MWNTVPSQFRPVSLTETEREEEKEEVGMVTKV